MEKFKEDALNAQGIQIPQPTTASQTGTSVNPLYTQAINILNNNLVEYQKTEGAITLKGTTERSKALFDQQFGLFKNRCVNAIKTGIENGSITENNLTNGVLSIYNTQLEIFIKEVKELQASQNLEKNSVENVEGEGLSLSSLNNIGLKISKSINSNLKADDFNTKEGLGIFVNYMGYKRSSLSESKIAEFKNLRETNTSSTSSSSASSTTLPGNLVFKITFKNSHVEEILKGKEEKKSENSTENAENIKFKDEEGNIYEKMDRRLLQASKTIKLAESYLQELEQLQENVFSDAKDKLKNLVGKVGNKLTNLSKDKTQADTSQELTVKKEDIIKKCESIQNSVLESTQAIKKINSGEGQDLKTFIVSFNKGKEPYWSDKAKGMVFTIEIAGSQKQQGKVMNFLTKMANIATNA